MEYRWRKIVKKWAKNRSKWRKIARVNVIYHGTGRKIVIFIEKAYKKHSAHHARNLANHHASSKTHTKHTPNTHQTH